MLDSSLFQGLDDAGRRRLWLLEVLIQKVEPSAVLDLAAKMESFVRGEIPAIVAGTRETKASARGSSAQSADATFVSGTPRLPTDQSALGVVESPADRCGSRLLHGKALQEFTDALGAGADNTELARRFGMTPRQANGLRMGIQKRFPHLRMTKVVKPKKPEIDRPTELQMQEVFLRSKPQATMTVDDVVRFLRQRGDEVVRREGNFVVNGQRTLTTAELVARANVKRTELRLPVFSRIWNVTPEMPQERARSMAVSDAVPLCGDSSANEQLAKTV